MEAGEVVAVLGPNGAGTTTLLSAVAGLVRPDAGEISVMGVDAAARPPAARRGSSSTSPPAASIPMPAGP